MQKIKNNLSIILICVSIILFVVAIVLVSTNNFEFKNNTNNETPNNKIEKNIDDKKVKEDKTVEEIKPTPTIKPSTKPKSTPTPTPASTKTPVPTSTPTPTPREEKKENVETVKPQEVSLLSHLQTEESMIQEGKSEDKTLREKIKDGFISTVDFIFYDKEINGYKFKELTNSAKLKVISVALAMDNKIDKYFPNYKDTIKDKYTDIKGKLAVKYIEYSVKLCESVGEDSCNQAKEDFANLKEKFGLGWDIVKELAKSGSAKVKEFYENFRDK